MTTVTNLNKFKSDRKYKGLPVSFCVDLPPVVYKSINSPVESKPSHLKVVK